MKFSQAIYNFIGLPAFFAGSIAVSIYLVINLFTKFGWILCLTFIASFDDYIDLLRQKHYLKPLSVALNIKTGTAFICSFSD